MNQERIDVMLRVLKGELSEDHVTLEEAEETLALVQNAVMEKTIEDLAKSNPMVFSGVDNDTLN